MGLFGGFIEKFKQGLAKTKEVFTAPLRENTATNRDSPDVEACVDRGIVYFLGSYATIKNKQSKDPPPPCSAYVILE